jgi:protein-disulfide isomerase
MGHAFASRAEAVEADVVSFTPTALASDRSNPTPWQDEVKKDSRPPNPRLPEPRPAMPPPDVDPNSPVDPLVGRTVGKYRIVQFLAAVGMGTHGKWLLLLGGVAILLTTFILQVRNIRNQVVPVSRRRIEIPAHSPRLGPQDAKVTVVRFSDFASIFNGEANAILPEIIGTYPRDVAIVFRTMPQDRYPNSRDAARAFLAAARQGKAWQMHDRLFANRRTLQPPALEAFAAEIGLDLARFKQDVADPTIEQLIVADETYAGQLGAVEPTFFINGEYFLTLPALADFKRLVEREIKRADKLLADGIRPADLYDKLVQ